MLIDKYVVAAVFKREHLRQALKQDHQTPKPPHSAAQRSGLIPLPDKSPYRDPFPTQDDEERVINYRG